MKKHILFGLAILAAASVKVYAQFVNNGNLVISNNFSLVVSQGDFQNNGTVTMKNDGKLYLRQGDLVNDGNFGDPTLTQTGHVYFDGTDVVQEIRGANEPYIYSLHAVQSGNAYVEQKINVTTYAIEVGDADNMFDYKVKDPSTDDIKGLRLYADEFTLNGNLRLYDDSQILQKGDGITVTGSGKVYRDQMGHGNKYWYNYWCSPVNRDGEWKLAYLMDGRDPENPQDINWVYERDADGANEVNSGQNPANLNSAWVYYFPAGGNDYNNWQYIGDSVTITPGFGYTMKGPDIQNAARPGTTGPTNQFKAYTFAGSPNGGTYTFSLNADEIILLGNPYLSAFDANDFINYHDNNVSNKGFNGTLYFWEHVDGSDHILRNYVGGYATYNLSGGSPARDWQTDSIVGTKEPQRYIPVAQGFFLMADDDGGTIELRNDFQEFYREDNNQSVFMRTTDTDIRIKFTDPEGLQRELLLAVRPGTTLGFDWGWDGPFFGDSRYSDMHFVIDDRNYVIQAIPELTSDLRLPLHIFTRTSGSVRIEVSELLNVPSDVEMYIEDTQTGMTEPLTLQNDFRTYLQAGDYTNRFYLVFRPAETTKADELNQNAFTVYYADDMIRITNPEGIQIDRAYVFDLTGKVIKEADLHTDAKQIQVPVSLKTGVYLLQVTSGHKKLAKKFIVD
ncbi:MAG: T9SS type A sorting domain-containing protein [Chlorobi bacterium]|nr:T9SS type A sorting domain-containing protein [Chlorobiota bacterium]